jgi:hypothetical protein
VISQKDEAATTHSNLVQDHDLHLANELRRVGVVGALVQLIDVGNLVVKLLVFRCAASKSEDPGSADWGCNRSVRASLTANHDAGHSDQLQLVLGHVHFRQNAIQVAARTINNVSKRPAASIAAYRTAM